jgi:AAA domain
MEGLRSHLSLAPLVSIHGPAGAGKSRLLRELAATFEVPVTIVQCLEGDRAVSVRSRIERRLRCHAGGLEMALQQQARVIAIDDIHHLSLDELTALLMPIVPSATALGRLVLIGRDPMVAAGPLVEMGVGGLDASASGQLWSHLEGTLGEVPGAFDSAFARTRGAPMGLRREYARARFGADAWAHATLSPAARTALEAMAVLRIPVAPAGLAAMNPGLAVEAAVDELSARQDSPSTPTPMVGSRPTSWFASTCCAPSRWSAGKRWRCAPPRSSTAAAPVAVPAWCGTLATTAPSARSIQ